MPRGKPKKEGKMVTKPTKFSSGAELIRLWNVFCLEISANDYEKVPTQTEFCRWMEANYEKADRKTIYNSLHKNFPDIKEEFERMQSDTVSTGAMLGKYQPTMSIFVLKNWCGWVDKLETKNESNFNITGTSGELQKLINERKSRG